MTFPATIRFSAARSAASAAEVHRARSIRNFLLVVLAVFMALPLAAQRRRDPLTDAETDQLREAAMDGDIRMKLWVKFIRARLVAIDQTRSDPKFAAERGKRLHDLIEDLSVMVDEMDDNVDNFAKQKVDIRKSLKDIVELDSELQLKLRSVKEAAATPEAAKDASQYKFVLENAIESVNASADGARDTLAEQNEEFKKKKEDKKKK